jgi:ribosomal peptide maturation radical SAM protein 1
VKQHHPGIATALGGANCEGAMGAALHELFPFVDYVCSGEGDRVVPELARRVLAGEPVEGLPGIHARGAVSVLGDETHTPLVRGLDALPYPDYTDYFAQFAASGLGAVETPTLALETSRGCWWGQKHHCTFCGLNGEGMEYRSKSPQRALAEIDSLLSAYPSRKLYAVDNILDFRYFDSLLRELAERPRPPRLYYETKANLAKQQLRLMRRAGIWGIQPGIESLSTAVLRLMDKGVTGLQNVRLLKWCAEIGLQVDWTFLCGFPGEDPSEYERAADLLPLLAHLQPPTGIYPLRLDRFSPYFAAPEANGMVAVRPAAGYRHVYPFSDAQLRRLAYYFDFDYADGRDPAQYTARLRTALDSWRAQVGQAQLELRDDGERLVILDTRAIASRRETELTGPARLAFLELDAGNTAPGVHAALGKAPGDQGLKEQHINRWLADWLEAGLVYREGQRYLSLATNPAERVELPVDRFLAALAGSAS